MTDRYAPPPCEHRPDLPAACSACVERMQRVAVREKVSGRRFHLRGDVEERQESVMRQFAAEQGWEPVGPARHRWLDMRDAMDRYEVRDWLDDPEDPTEIPGWDMAVLSEWWCLT